MKEGDKELRRADSEFGEMRRKYEWGRQVNEGQECPFQDVKGHKRDWLRKGSKLEKVETGHVGQQVGKFWKILCREAFRAVKSGMLCRFGRGRAVP